MKPETIVFACGIALGCASAALAQPALPPDSVLRYEVWNGSSWTTSVVAQPGSRVEVRALVSYVGNDPRVRSFARFNYQPVFSNWDNEGSSQDNIGAWRGNGVGSSSLGNILTQAEGSSGAPLATYGRVVFASQSTSTGNLNVVTSFRHTDGSRNAPPGSWLRVAGSFVEDWPQSGTQSWSNVDTNRTLRGLVANQGNELLGDGQPNPHWQGGTTDLVIFRQAVFLSDSTQDRVIEVFSEQSSLLRMSTQVGSSDNRRYMAWWIGPGNSTQEQLRTGVIIEGAQIIIPSPSVFALIWLGSGMCFSRRR